MVPLLVEWNPDKARENLRKHAVGFEEAASVFCDPLSITIPDPDHSRREARFLDLGLSHGGRLLVVSYTERGQRLRIISARLASGKEKRDYERSDD